MAKGAYIGVPKRYKVLEYIESTGEQYCDLGLKLNQDSKVELAIIGTSGTGGRKVFGSRSSATENNFSVTLSGGSIVLDFCNYNENRFTYAFADNEVLEISVDKEWLRVNDAKQAISTYSGFETPENAYLFNCSGNYPSGYALASTKFLYGKISNNTAIARDYVPVICEDGEVGLLDKAHFEFYPNAGPGEFIAGPETGEIISVPVARKVKKGYIGIEGVARKIKKAYIGVPTEFPVYEESSTAITENNVAEFFDVATTGSYGFTGSGGVSNDPAQIVNFFL